MISQIMWAEFYWKRACVCVCIYLCSAVINSLWPHQASLCMEFSRQESWSGLPLSTPVRHSERKKSESEVAQLCPTLCDPMDCSLLGSSIYGIFQARILEWVAISFSRRSSQPRDWTWVSCIVGRCFTV